MKPFFISRQIVVFPALLLVSFAIGAQDTKKEIHIKITENGIVTKDTTYVTSIDSLEIERFVVGEECQSKMGEKYTVEKKFVIKSDGGNDEETPGNNDKDQKEVTVTVQSDDEMSQNVEEIWIHGDGGPCHTIIIHEGACRGGNLETNYRVIHSEGPKHMEGMMPPPLSKHGGRNSGYVEKKVIRTDDGDKVIIIETRNDGRNKHRRKGD